MYIAQDNDHGRAEVLSYGIRSFRLMVLLSIGGDCWGKDDVLAWCCLAVHTGRGYRCGIRRDHTCKPVEWGVEPSVSLFPEESTSP
jgi:hypothetical protein